jgi:hypothetical protein
MLTEFPPLIGLYSPTSASGKSTVARYLKDVYGYTIIPFASPIKSLVNNFLLLAGLTAEEAEEAINNNKQKLIPQVGVSSRHLMQTLGTEWGRACVHPEIWIRCWENTFLTCKSPRVVVDDMRFPNEAEVIRRIHGGYLWHIYRPESLIQTPHASEGGLNRLGCFDSHIFNAGDLDTLYKQVDKILKESTDIAA